MQITRLNKKYLIWALFPLTLFYWGIIYWRNFFYNFGFFVSKRLPCTVISIGNMTVGGTGKTPMVIFLAQLIKKHGKKVAILSRGYGRKTRGTVLVTDGNSKLISNFENCGDEPYLLAKTLKGVPIVVDDDRFRGGMFLTQRFQSQIIILDDGFQHRALERDLDIVLVNACDRLIDHKLLPYGILREPWKNIARADAIILTKTNLQRPKPFLSTKLNETDTAVFHSKMESIISPIGYRSNSGTATLKNKNIFLFSAIGDPTSFIKSMKNLGALICGTKAFDDHYCYSQQDIIIINQQANKTDAEYLVTTEKDWVKIQNFTSVYPIIVFGVHIIFYNERKLKQLLQPFIS